MKILLNFYFRNTKKENIEYDKYITLSKIIEHINKFIQEEDQTINFDSLVTKWSDLNNILNKYGDIPLFKLIKLKNKFKVCYGGYIKFIVLYNKIEIITLFQNHYNNNINNKNHLNEFYLTENFILKYLSNEDLINLALINKYSYSLIKNNILFNKEIYFKNNIDNKEEEENKIINFKKFFLFNL